MTLARQFEQFIDRLELRYFKGHEFTPYWTRVRNGVRNACPAESLWPNIIPTMIVLDALRHKLGYAIDISTSTYRRPAYNAAVGGESGSFHMQFKAVDFTALGGSPGKWAAALRLMREKLFKLPGNGGAFPFRGGIGTYGSFVHVDTRGWNANW